MKIAVLALQGAFAEHQQMLHKLGVDSVLIRNLNDWNDYLADVAPDGNLRHAGLIIPGGESTAMMRIIRDEELFHPIREAIIGGLPVFGTCAGLIMLDSDHLATMDIKAKRNAYGRQLGSFHAMGEFRHITDAFSASVEDSSSVPMTFIRAPYIESVGEGVEVLSVVDGHIVAARQRNMLVTAFHPELDDDTRIHEYFLSFMGSI